MAASLKAPSLLLGSAADWELVFADEFDYSDADLDKNWASQNGPSGNIPCSRWRENACVADGTLKLVIRRECRGGQDWTAGNLWSREKFLYGYFECRYRYAASKGTNNSFWIMTQGALPPGKKAFEIDVNEGHYPNEVATNIHNWTDVVEIDGKKCSQSNSKVFPFGVQPDRVVQLEIPVATSKLRLSSDSMKHFHVKEFRVYPPSAAGYPDPLSATADEDIPSLTNLARDPAAVVTVSGYHTAAKPGSEKLVADGSLETGWISNPDGPKWIQFEFPAPVTVGCVQFVTGWKSVNGWNDPLDSYVLQYHNGTKWVDMSSFDVARSDVNFARDFHTFGLDWSESGLVFYVDGKELRREKNDFCHAPAPVWLSLAIAPWAGNACEKTNGTFMEVDYVRIYKRK